MTLKPEDVVLIVPKRNHHLLLLLVLLLLSPILGYDRRDPHGSLFFFALELYTAPIAVGVLIYWYRLHRRRHR